ncbi:MAG: 4-hydroxy-3-methylbut-2-enyl diphosphate reductase [Bacteroidaceae bacterium]|nr:4-hydroxy-3-methylbut-2-enyl diphosphate reductase [Bacteroidaceae bacterium]
MTKIEIDTGSGFCFGVTRAIGKAEEELQRGHDLYCLGDIVHNGREVERLGELGLRTIDHEQFEQLHDANVLLRAHGEPPETYARARANHINIIDATCPVVLHLQERIKREYDSDTSRTRQIVIFGKPGHAEVLGLVGQTEGTAIVIESPDDARRLDFTRDIALYSQTTKSLEGFRQVVDYIRDHIAPTAHFTFADTICRQVANRMPHIRDFAARHDVVLFVCGHKSSNGRVLFGECQSVNPCSYMVSSPDEICAEYLAPRTAAPTELTIGICGATSTPKWLMEQCRDRVEQLLAP